MKRKATGLTPKQEHRVERREHQHPPVPSQPKNIGRGHENCPDMKVHEDLIKEVQQEEWKYTSNNRKEKNKG